jgi:fatty acid desaturase
MTTVESQPSGHHLASGYQAAGWLLAELPKLQRVSLVRAMTTALLDHAMILAAGVGGLLAFRHLPALVAIPAYAALGLVAARGMRGLECLVHEASHVNWTRPRRRLNDRLANVLAAWPVLSAVANYRRSHLVHHASLGSEEDTDLVRWRALALGDLDRRKPLALAGGLARRMIPYLLGWWAAIGVDRRTTRRCIAWHGLVVLVAITLLPADLVLGVWLLAWPIPFFLILPGVRFVGEIEEHRYDGVRTVIEATYTNVGMLQRLIFHPHGDAYHTFHHLFAAVPFFRVRKLHDRLMAENLGGYRDLVTQRERVRTPTSMPDPTVNV